MKGFKKIKCDRAWEMIESLAASNDFEARQIEEWHIRMQFKDCAIDYFPWSEKYTIVGSGTWGKIDLIALEEMIEKKQPSRHTLLKQKSQCANTGN